MLQPSRSVSSNEATRWHRHKHTQSLQHALVESPRTKKWEESLCGVPRRFIAVRHEGVQEQRQKSIRGSRFEYRGQGVWSGTSGPMG